MLNKKRLPNRSREPPPSSEMTLGAPRALGRGILLGGDSDSQDKEHNRSPFFVLLLLYAQLKRAS